MTRVRRALALALLAAALVALPAAPAGAATVRDILYADVIAAGPFLSPDLAVDVSTRVDRLGLASTGAVLRRQAASPRGYAVVPVAAHAAGVLSIVDNRLVRTALTSTAVRQAWTTRYQVLDADYAPTGAMVALLRGQRSTVALVRGSLSTTSLRTVHGWALDRGLDAHVVLSRDGRTAYVALPVGTATAVLRVVMATGTVRSVASIPGVSVRGLDLSPDGAYLVVATSRAAESRTTQSLVLLPASGGRGSWHLDVPASQVAGRAGAGPSSVAFSADGRRLLLSYGYTATVVGFDTLDVAPGALLQVARTPGARPVRIPLDGVAGYGVAPLRP